VLWRVRTEKCKKIKNSFRLLKLVKIREFKKILTIRKMRILKLWLSLPETVTQSVGSLYINLLIIIDYCWLLIDYWYLLIYDLLILSLLSDNFTRSVVCRLVVCIACDRVEHLLVWLVLYTWSLHPTFSFRTFLSFVIYFILFHKFVDGVILSYGGDTQSRNLYKWTCTRNLTVWHGFLYKIFPVQVSCTQYSTGVFHTGNLHARD